MNLKGSTHKGMPPLRVWELNETSTRFDYMLAAPADSQLVIYWSTWSALAFLASSFVLVVFLAVVTSKKTRQHSFNIYLIYLMIPDLLFSLFCAITCLMNAIKGEYYSGWMCNFQQWYCVWGIGSNMWINSVIAYQLHSLLKHRRDRKRYTIPSQKTARNHALAIYIYTGLLGCLGFMEGPLFYSRAPSGLACLPIETDLTSTFTFFFVFLPAFAGIPITYIFYVGYDIWKKKLLPEKGKMREIVMYFSRVIFVFIAMWVPFMILFVTSRWVPPFAHFIAGSLTHLQGLLSSSVSLPKPDIWHAVKSFVTCQRFRVQEDDSDDISVTTGIIDNYHTDRDGIMISVPKSCRTKCLGWMSSKVLPTSSNDDTETMGNNIQNEWCSWALPGPRKAGPSVEAASNMWPNKDGNYGDGDYISTLSKELGIDQRTKRLIIWNSQVMLEIIRKIIARRLATSYRQKQSAQNSSNLTIKTNIPLDEVAEIISLPEFDRNVARRQQDPETVEISPIVVNQLQNYITCVAGMYNDNPFHNFDHASHVVMSLAQLMSRIVAPADEDSHGVNRRKSNTAEILHDHTYGITSDPLTQFACVFSALIHDVDHAGVPNGRLAEENVQLGTTYKNRSIAEQNSFELSWNLLMEDRYLDLRTTLCAHPRELSRFRQIVINSVMATDIMDKQLKDLRNGRWDKAFKKTEDGNKSSEFFNEDRESSSDFMKLLDGSHDNTRNDVNRKATIVIEHLIQTADVSHTMQHWHVYRKWNERLFREMYSAYKNGRADIDPSKNWYKGEIGFFDFYIIPLARKMEDCGVFGVSSKEYLYYAKKNRKEWEDHGFDVVEKMIANVKKEYEAQEEEEEITEQSSEMQREETEN